ncbi:helix-turn-helix domain-containing protein [Corallibacter sp.]|uniref:helix-turn-helix domain-containing protein n=1 Tax=Corallibacter sp. TaxID=2038084 RepID=UPI003AB5ABCA
MEHIKEVLERIEATLLYQKKSLTLKEACTYMGLSENTMYKHTSKNKIPYYKPEGKTIYFKKEELDDWMLRNRQSSNEELLREASKYSLTRKR